MDARTFEEEEIVRVPNFESPPTSRPPTARQRSNSPPSMRPSSSTTDLTQSLPPPPHIVLFSSVLEDTFRISSSDSTGRRRRHGRRMRSGDEPSGEEDGDGIVVIPALGDREVDEDVRRLFNGRRVLRARSNGVLESSITVGDINAGDERAEDDMDVDELESDCLSSYAPSRESSPIPSSGPLSQFQSQSQSQPQAPMPSSLPRLDSSRRTNLLARRESSGPYMSRRTSNHSLRRPRRGSPTDGSTDTEVEQDLAGTCFDPSGEYIYVAASRGISEWKVRGAEQSWWIDSSWA